MVDILKCHECGSIVQVLADNGSECSLHMQKIPVQTEGENAAKHKPIIEIDGDIVTVKIGKVTHPMEDNHYIQFVLIKVGDEQYIKCFKPGDIPKATFVIDIEKLYHGIVVYEFCNVHGLWSSE